MLLFNHVLLSSKDVALQPELLFCMLPLYVCYPPSCITPQHVLLAVVSFRSICVACSPLVFLPIKMCCLPFYAAHQDVFHPRGMSCVCNRSPIAQTALEKGGLPLASLGTVGQSDNPNSEISIKTFLVPFPSKPLFHNFHCSSLCRVKPQRRERSHKEEKGEKSYYKGGLQRTLFSEQLVAMKDMGL